MSRRTAFWNAVATVVAVGCLFSLVDPAGRAPEWARFVARQHPALVHLPIGFLLFGALLALGRRWRKEERPGPIEQTALVLGGWSAVAAAAAGSWLIQMGAFPADALYWHRLLGLFIPLAAAGTLFFSLDDAPRTLRTASWTLLVGSLFIGGHLGGEMTHGKGYVAEYAPGFLQPVLGEAPSMTSRFALDAPDSTTIYAGIVDPIFRARCTSCHGEGRSKGGLDLTTADAIAAHETDTEDDPLITWGDPSTSLLIQRITLPVEHRRAMPPSPDARPLSHGDVELIKWWVDSEAAFDGTIAATDMPRSIQTLLEAYGLGEILTGVFALDIPMPDTALVSAANGNGLRLTRVSAEGPFLELACDSPACLSSADLDRLTGHIITADLSGSDASNDVFDMLTRFPHLTSIDLSRTSVTGRGLDTLAELGYLTRLNLYGTQLDDAGLEHAEGLATLESIYVWQTDVTEAGVAQLRDARPDMLVNDGR